jgi:hypothetical protein
LILYTAFAELPIIAFDMRQREFTFEDFAVQVQFDLVVFLIRYFIRAGIDYSDIASAFIHGALVGEELQGVIGDFYGTGGGSDKLLWCFVEAVGLEGVTGSFDTPRLLRAGLEHKIPMDVRTGRMLLNNEFFTFICHSEVL